jgi:hypothetical protein
MKITVEEKFRRTDLEKEFKKAQKMGYITSIASLPERSGIEINLPANIHPDQANRIVSYIQNKYKFHTCFYVKKNNIKVFYLHK